MLSLCEITSGKNQKTFESHVLANSLILLCVHVVYSYRLLLSILAHGTNARKLVNLAHWRTTEQESHRTQCAKEKANHSASFTHHTSADRATGSRLFITNTDRTPMQHSSMCHNNTPRGAETRDWRFFAGGSVSNTPSSYNIQTPPRPPGSIRNARHEKWRKVPRCVFEVLHLRNPCKHSIAFSRSNSVQDWTMFQNFAAQHSSKTRGDPAERVKTFVS